LQFTPDSKVLYFTTTLLNAVQSYSLREARLLDPGPTHASAPTVLAISPKSHLLLTASELPPTVYLQNLALGTQPLLLHPHASFSPVACAAFHPERPNIFLLAFKDGTLAVYDSTQLMKPFGRGNGNPRSEGQEIASFESLHNVATHTACIPAGGLEVDTADVLDTESGLRSFGITGAAFLPRFRNRIVTVGADGKCNVVDFEKNQIVRTWHIKGPATSLTILSPVHTTNISNAGVSRRPSAMGGTSSTVLSIGRIDGKVLFFDSSGAKLHDLTVDDTAGRVVDVEWVKGPGPKILGDSAKIQFTSETWIELFTIGETLRSRKSKMSEESLHLLQKEPRKNCEENSPLHRVMRADESTRTSPEVSPSSSPDVLERVKMKQPIVDISSTIKHNELEGPVHRDLPPVSNNNYMDLFSPVKQPQQPTSPLRPSPPRRRTTPRPRPRLSSSTFVYQGTNSQSPPQPNFRALEEMSNKPDPMKSTFVTSKPSGQHQTSLKKRNFVPNPSHDPYISPVLHSVKIPGSYSHSNSAIPPRNTSATSINSQILADLCRFSGKGTSSKGGSSANRAILAPYMSSQPRKVSPKRPILGGRSVSKGKALSMSQPSPATAKTITEIGTEEDIWLTAESDDDDEPSMVLPGARRQPVRSNHERKVSWQGSQVCEENEGGTSRRSYRGRDPSPSPDPKDFGGEISPVYAQKRYNSQRKSGNHPPERKTEEVIIPLSPREHLASSVALPPGFAHSFHGPVPVASYLPRKGSLAFGASSLSSPLESPYNRRSALGELSGNEQKERNKAECDHLPRRSQVSKERQVKMGMKNNTVCAGCEDLRSKVERLREEVALLRGMLEGKDMELV
jgi:WD40 repeat protein